MYKKAISLLVGLLFIATFLYLPSARAFYRISDPEVAGQLKEIKLKIHQAKCNFIEKRNEITTELREQISPLDTSVETNKLKIKALRKEATEKMQQIRREMEKEVISLKEERREITNAYKAKQQEKEGKTAATKKKKRSHVTKKTWLD